MVHSLSRLGSRLAICLAVTVAALLGSHVCAADVMPRSTCKLVPIEVRLSTARASQSKGPRWERIGLKSGDGERFRAQADGLQGTEWRYDNHTRSGPDGIARLAAEPKYFGDWSSLVARHEARRIAGHRQYRSDKSSTTRSGSCFCPLDGDRWRGRFVLSFHPMCSMVSTSGFFKSATRKGSSDGGFRDPRFRISCSAGNLQLLHDQRLQPRRTRTMQPGVVVPGTEGATGREPIKLKLALLARLVGQTGTGDTGRGDLEGIASPSSLPTTTRQGRAARFGVIGANPVSRRCPRSLELYEKYHDRGLEVVGVHIDSGDDDEGVVDNGGEA